MRINGASNNISNLQTKMQELQQQKSQIGGEIQAAQGAQNSEDTGSVFELQGKMQTVTAKIKDVKEQIQQAQNKTDEQKPGQEDKQLNLLA